VVEVIPTGTVTRGKMYRMDHKQGDRVTVPTRHTAALLDAWEWSELDPRGEWQQFLAARTFEPADGEALRAATYSGRPLGADLFVSQLAGEAGTRPTGQDRLARMFHRGPKREASEARGYKAREAWRAEAYLNSTVSTASKRNAVDAGLSRLAVDPL
jgi:hypothetical protein